MRAFLIGGTLALVAGAVLLVADVVPALGFALLGVGGVVLVSLAFYAVGESEDRDRAKHPHG